MLNKEQLIKWLQDVVESGKNDDGFSIFVFKETIESDFIICAGWAEGFDPKDKNCLLSESDPTYGLCVKVGINSLNGVFDYYDMIMMPYNEDGNVEDTEISFSLNPSPQEIEEKANSLLKDYKYFCEKKKEE